MAPCVAWGDDSNCQLGIGIAGLGAYSSVPVRVLGLDGITAIASGHSHTIALRNDGTVWTWGYNAYGQLGDGTNTNRPLPVQVPGMTGVTAIAAGIYHTLVLKNDGTVWAWGKCVYSIFELTVPP